MTGFSAGLEAWRAGALSPSDTQYPDSWDRLEDRLTRYIDANHYFNNTVYTSIQKYAEQKKLDTGLYKHIRPIYNPVARLVGIYRAKVYGGQLDLENLESGAIPIEAADERLRDAIRQVWRWSNWGSQKTEYIDAGATFGDAPIKVVDDRERGQVRLDAMHPGLFQDVDFDDVGNVTRVVIAYRYFDKQSKRSYWYREVIDEEMFRTFRGDELYAYHVNLEGDPVAEWPNEYGFVPVVWGKHRAVLGKQFGANSFHASYRKIDHINGLASVLHDNVRKAVNPVWAVSGARDMKTNLTRTERDEMLILQLPEGGSINPMVATIDIAGSLAALDHSIKELEADMPELALHRIRESGNLTAPGVKAGWADAIDRIEEARGNYDSTLARAQQMAVAIGGHNGYGGFEPFDLRSYERGDLEHQIAERPVIEDSLSKEQTITFLIQATSLPVNEKKIAYKELGIPQDDIDAATEGQVAQENAAIAALVNELSTGGNGNASTDAGTGQAGAVGNSEAANQPVNEG
ncbi:hypothetical protein GF380_02310 [Candidatus Uhrbacteria bacterium]|nr:hypothetical protein [Candidatus Uhrbacteria bacterium]